MRSGSLDLLHGGLEVEKCASATWARDKFGLAHAQTSGLKNAVLTTHQTVGIGVLRGFEPNAVAKTVEQQCAEVGTRFHLQPLDVGVGIRATSHHGHIYSGGHQGVKHGLKASRHVYIGRSDHEHGISHRAQRFEAFDRRVGARLYPHH